MEQKNLILAIVASLAILLGYEYFIAQPQRDSVAQQQAAQQQLAQSSETIPSTAPGGAVPLLGQPGEGAKTAGLTREAAIAGPRVSIETPTIRGSISLKGGRIDDVVLTQYRETIDPTSPEIVMFSPNGAPQPYFADFGWTGAETSLLLPSADSLWQADRTRLTPDQPVTLTWDNGQGLLFKRIYKVDENYMFTVSQSVENNSSQAISISPYGLVSRTGTPETRGFYILHEGMIGVFDEKLKEVKYSKLEDDGTVSAESLGGWMGITDKYWMATLIPDQTSTVNARFVASKSGGKQKYQADYLYGALTIPAGGATEVTNRLFAGAKQVNLIDGYAEEYSIPRFDRAVDFGWFYFLTKPIFVALHWLNSVVGNFGISILILTVFIKALFFPLANKSYKSMAKMRKLQPQMLVLREQFGDDKQRLNQEMMALYKKEGANPVSGCLPVVVQIPVFFSLYKVLFVTIEMRQAPFFGWIQDLSAPDPTSIINLFGLLPFTVPDLGPLNLINLGVWPLLMGISMFVQQRLNPQPTDEIQAKVFMFMPIIFTFLLANFPAGLVIYWTWNNTLSVLQQATIMKRQGVPIGRQAQATAAVKKPDPKAGTHAPKKPAKDETEDAGGSKASRRNKKKPSA